MTKLSIYCFWLPLLTLFSLFFSVAIDVYTVTHPSPLPEISHFSVRHLAGEQDHEDQQLFYDFYRFTCPNAERTVFEIMREIVANDTKVTAQLLRLMFHDCFILGCDASLLLNDSRGDQNHMIEREAVPNRTIKGFEIIDRIKDALEKECPNVVSCADIITLATRNGIILSGGPFFPVLTGRRDSQESHFNEANQQLPRPDNNITRTLNLFSQRGFNEKETVSLLGAHNIGKIGCEFIQQRLSNFQGTGKPDPSISADFTLQLKRSCSTSDSPSPLPSRFRTLIESATGLSYYQFLAPFIFSGAGFDTHFYKSLILGRALLYSDQQLMTDPRTARLVEAFASDDGSTFRLEFAKAMLKMSNLDPLTGSQGEVRTRCSFPNNSN